MINYDSLAPIYVQHREPHSRVVEHLIEIGKIGVSSTVLEVGCGTGNYLTALHNLCGCTGKGIDPSTEMLAWASKLSSGINFKAGRAEQLDFPENTFDLVFSVDVIHHVENRQSFFQEAYRVTKVGGQICTVTESTEMIRRRAPLAVYFPETIERDLARYPTIPEIRGYMAQAGFTRLSEVKVELAYSLTELKPFHARAFSCLHLITEEAFRRGIRRMEQALLTGPIPGIWSYLLVWGIKEEISHFLA